MRAIFQLRFIYCDDAQFKENDLMDVFKLAQQLQVKELVQTSVDRLIKSELNQGNALQIYEQVYQYDEPRLGESIRSYVRYNQNEWLTKHLVEKLSRKSMQFLLAQPTLGVVESELVELTFHWARTQIKKQTDHEITPQMVRETLDQLLYMLRIPLIQTDQLINGPAKALFSDQEILDIVYYQMTHDHIQKAIVSRFDLHRRNLSTCWSVNVVPDYSFPSSLAEKKNYTSFKIDFVLPLDFCLNGFKLYTSYDVTFSAKVIVDQKEVHAINVDPQISQANRFHIEPIIDVIDSNDPFRFTRQRMTFKLVLRFCYFSFSLFSPNIFLFISPPQSAFNSVAVFLLCSLQYRDLHSKRYFLIAELFIFHFYMQAFK